MTKVEKILVMIALYLIAIALLLNAFNGRFKYIMGQNDIHNVDYLPKVLDSWTGKLKSIF